MMIWKLLSSVSMVLALLAVAAAQPELGRYILIGMGFGFGIAVILLSGYALLKGIGAWDALNRALERR